MNWLSLFIVLLVIEFMTVNLVTIWFAIGALFACVTTFITDSLIIQTCVFFIVSVASLIITRPIVKKYLSSKRVKINYDKVIGMIGIVTKDIKPLENGEVKVDGKYWTAKSDEEIKEGSKVEILSIEGVKLIVKKEDLK